MVQIRETDYHHGALTSVLVNNGYNMILLETHETRRSYKVTQGETEFIIYSKYASRPSSIGEESSTWTYSFTLEEIEKIKSYIDESENLTVALISGNSEYKGGQLVILSKEEFLRCIGNRWQIENANIRVRREKYCPLRVYGTGLSRKDAIIPKTNEVIRRTSA